MQISIFDLLEHQNKSADTHMITFKKLKKKDKENLLKELEQIITNNEVLKLDFIWSGIAFEAWSKNGAYIDFGVVHKEPVMVEGRLCKDIVKHSFCIRFNESYSNDPLDPKLENLPIEDLKTKIAKIAIMKTHKWLLKERSK